MATWDITVPAGSGVTGTGSSSSGITPPGDFDGSTIDGVAVVGTPALNSDGATDDTLGIRWRIQTTGGVAVYGDFGSDAASLCSAVLGASVSSNTIADGSSPSPAPSAAVAADWDEIAYQANYSANMKDDGETCSWSSFTIRVTYTPDANETVTITQATMAQMVEQSSQADSDLSSGSGTLAQVIGQTVTADSLISEVQAIFASMVGQGLSGHIVSTIAEDAIGAFSGQEFTVQEGSGETVEVSVVALSTFAGQLVQADSVLTLDPATLAAFGGQSVNAAFGFEIGASTLQPLVGASLVPDVDIGTPNAVVAAFQGNAIAISELATIGAATMQPLSGRQITVGDGVTTVGRGKYYIGIGISMK